VPSTAALSYVRDGLEIALLANRWQLYKWARLQSRVFAMSKKILVVEDEPASLKVLRYFLSHEGYEVVGAKDGVEALELLAQSRFDLVLSDLKMPRIDGLALARHLLAHEPITPIVLVTAYDFDSREDILETERSLP
jgi:CheY-like chemotaxis protein